MVTRGKSINLFLMDGEPSGRIKCILANWTGVAYKIPRVALDLCKERDDLKQSGIYFLFGVSDETGNPLVYVGQAGARKNGEGLLCRLQEHRRDSAKNYWTEAILFTTSNNSFGSTEISYLENRFCRLAVIAKRYDVKNGNDPTPGNITEEKESELEEFVDNARILMGVLGHKVFEPLVALESATDCMTDPLLYLKRKNVEARGRRTSDGFVLLKGSSIIVKLQASCPKNVVLLRERCKSQIGSDHVLIDDVLLSSPSAALHLSSGRV